MVIFVISWIQVTAKLLSRTRIVDLILWLSLNILKFLPWVSLSSPLHCSLFIFTSRNQKLSTVASDCKIICSANEIPTSIYDSSSLGIIVKLARVSLSASFLVRCTFFCLLWVGTNYMYIHSLKILYATDVMALFATNVACVYLLSWVILHEQFVGVRVSWHLIYFNL